MYNGWIDSERVRRQLSRKDQGVDRNLKNG